jgi:hypothetical protein
VLETATSEAGPLTQRTPLPAQASPAPAADSAEMTRAQLASFQRGSRRARAVAETADEAKQRVRDH